ncbi:MAG: DMT family transporter [Chloroflexota bacterium]
MDSTIAKPTFSRIAFVALICGATAISFTPLYVRWSDAGPISTGMWRMALAWPVLWLLTQREAKQADATSKIVEPHHYRWLVLAGLLFAGDLAAFHLAVKYTSIANASVLANASPIVVAIGAWLLYNERITPYFVVGLVIAIVGAIMLVGSGFRLSLQTLWGDAFGLMTALFYGSYLVVVKKLRSDLSAPTILFWSCAVGSLSLMPLALILGEPFFASTVRGWLALFGLGILSQVGGQGLIAYALAHLPAAFSSVTLLIQPVLSTILAWLFLSEIIGPIQALGGVIVLIGIFIARN